MRKPPMSAPMSPMMMSMRAPFPPPPMTFPVNQPAIRPTMSHQMIPMRHLLEAESLDIRSASAPAPMVFTRVGCWA